DPSSKSLVWQTTTPTSTPPNIPLGRRPSAHKIVWQRLEDSPEQTAENQKEQFRKELLGGWDAEIAKMDLSRARWYLERMEQNRADKIMDQVTIIGKRKDSKPTLTKSNSTVCVSLIVLF